MIKSFEIYCQSKNIRGEIKLSGSKSVSNRVLLIKALCQDDFDIFNLSDSDDTMTMEYLLQSDHTHLDAHHAGTTFRFLTAYLATKQGSQILTGSERMKQRPVKILVDALNYLGANIEYMENEGFPPLKIGQPSSTWKNEINLSSEISSQYITALLLIAPTLREGLTIHLQGEVVSKPYIDLTIDIMAYFGVKVEWEGQSLKVMPQSYLARSFHVEADWSAASYYYTLAALSESARITLVGLHKDSSQGDAAIVEIGSKLGIETIFDKNKVTIIKEKENKFPDYFEYNFIKVPDIAQSVSVLCAGIGCTVLFSGLQTLSIKETDRTAALREEHFKFGVIFNKMPKKFSQKSGIEYYLQEGKSSPNQSQVPQIETYNDHRMAMSFAPLGVLFPIRINDPMVVSKSYPGFWTDIKSLGFTIKE